MPAWPALIVAPSIALTQLSIVYSMVWPACQRGCDTTSLHLVASACLAATVVLTLMARRGWRGSDVTAADSAAVEQRPPFVALVATCVGAMSALVCAALWMPLWVLQPCG